METFLFQMQHREPTGSKVGNYFLHGYKKSYSKAHILNFKISNLKGGLLLTSLLKCLVVVKGLEIRMIKINMIRRAVIKSDHPGRNCCRRSVVTTGGAVGRYHLLLGGASH